jgi:16S rRNA (cytidine1402-2'-O)-methyltransferase
MSGTLYIVATPIGNLEEMTFRAVRVLGEVDFIVCEDTRHSRILLEHYKICKPLISSHKFTEKKNADAVLARLKAGESAALISDAGMPGVFDPGAVLVGGALKEGIPYTVLSGACALVNAYVLSGFLSERFYFAGFLPQQTRERTDFLRSIAAIEGVLIFYSAPHDVNKDIASLYEVFGERKFAAVREMTKLYEEVSRGTLPAPLETPRGEYVLVVEGAGKGGNPLNRLTVAEHIKFYTDAGLTEKDAVKKAALDRGVPKSSVYAENVANKGK